MANGDVDSKSLRTWSLVFFVFVGAFVLAILTRSSELVYAYGIVSGGALTAWIGGKGIAGYTQMTQTIATTKSQTEATTKRVEAEAQVIIAKAEEGSKP